MKKTLLCLVGLFLLTILNPLFAQYQTKLAFPNLSFTNPVDLQDARDGSNRLFVVEQRGVIYVFTNDSATTVRTPFLDIRHLVDDSRSEEGLLGLVFHPDYTSNGYFYVNYTSDTPSNRSIISRFKVSDTDSNFTDPASELVLMELPKPNWNHNAGALAFGPNDGYLYITTGDGGGSGDPGNHGQNVETFLGAILRIDVDSTAGGMNYAIPRDNPFATSAGNEKKEIYAYGLRNPWRISFDPVTGWLWAADVGQNRYEEIDIIENGKNYGWKTMEGNHCFSPSNCNMSGLTLPIWEYNHFSGIGASITGGYVYRGTEIPDLVGKYIYADFLVGKIWALSYDGVNPAVNQELLDGSLFISSFGVDANNRLYICAFSGSNGKIYRLEGPPTGLEPMAELPKDFRLGNNYPNPFNPSTVIPYAIGKTGRVSIDVYDIRGKWMASLIDAELAAGKYETNWQGLDSQGNAVPSGIYFYRMTIDKKAVATAQMVLLK